MDPEFKKEAIALAKIIDDMDYYQILKVKQTAFTQEIKNAYFKQSRIYHPDKFYNEESSLQHMITKVFKRISESYKVLSDQEKRVAYTKAINGPERKKFLRYSSKLFEKAQNEKEDEGQTPMGKKYYLMAKTAMQNKDYSGAKINLQLAAKMEPNNQTFKAKIAEIDELMKLRKKQKI